jgi:hypothetical protein
VNVTVIDTHLIYSNGINLGEVLLDIDGYFYFWPNISIGGAWTSPLLREIADKLDEMNKDWDLEVEGMNEEPRAR